MSGKSKLLSQTAQEKSLQQNTNQKYNQTDENNQADFSNIIGIIYVLLLALFIIYIVKNIGKFSAIRSRPKTFCSNNTNQDCIPCPMRAICHNQNFSCLNGLKFYYVHSTFSRSFQLFDKHSSFGFCLPNKTDSYQISKMLSYSLKILKDQAGLYKCNLGKTDYYGQDQLELELIKKFTYFDNFDHVFNETIYYLKNERFITTKIISNATVFTSNLSNCPIKCKFKQFFVLILLSFPILVYSICKYTMMKKYRYRIEQCFQDSANYILAHTNREIAQFQLKEVIAPTCENFDYIWPFVLKRLKSVSSIGHKLSDGQMYYFSQY